MYLNKSKNQFIHCPHYNLQLHGYVPIVELRAHILFNFMSIIFYSFVGTTHSIVCTQLGIVDTVNHKFKMDLDVQKSNFFLISILFADHYKKHRAIAKIAKPHSKTRNKSNKIKLLLVSHLIYLELFYTWAKKVEVQLQFFEWDLSITYWEKTGIFINDERELSNRTSMTVVARYNAAHFCFHIK